ncbi:MAG: cytochrome C oxidase Cbb3 [Deltaproteobacteria bacterium]|nr:cytochrome-c oxidase, cbb3-type subunit I [Deltaproteobacteria bacterium]RLB52093.1 MAG: cytochrome C oxidase Cbb3 [Deltaproteobacteria bacterium]
METQRIVYNDKVVRQFLWASVLFGIVGMLVGIIVALQLAYWPANLAPYLSFGRLRPLHTNALIFAFVGNMLFSGIYYSTQRLVKARLASDLLSATHFWGWQLIIVAAAVTLPLGISTAKEYAELEWPIDIAIAVIWVVFAINFFWTLGKRREKHLYVAIWFYIATIITIAVLHIVNSFELPVSAWKSYSVFAGVQDAMVQWWYGHNAVAFFLTTPILGIMYYFLPKAADRPVFSYRLSIVHFWGLVFLYIWAGPHHLLYTALPDWAQSLGMVFSLMLWAPSWGGMLNGLLTLRGAWDKLRTDPVLKFLAAGVTFYGMSTFEGPLLSIKAVSGLAHYTDWIIAHVHGGTLGWNGLMAAGMFYWLVPRLYGTKLHSRGAANFHFWIATVGILLYVISMWVAGITQGLMWRAMNETGGLLYPNFVETLIAIRPMYWARLVGGSLYFIGFIIMTWNLIKTAQAGSAVDGEIEVPVLTEPRDKTVPWPKLVFGQPIMASVIVMALLFAMVLFDGLMSTVLALAAVMWIVAAIAISIRDRNSEKIPWHRAIEGRAGVFTVIVTLAILVGGIIEIIPLVISVPETIRTTKNVPYTPLELEGRDVYVREGCYTCHSQMIRPFTWETARYGEVSTLDDSIFDHPFQWGSRRIGPDLARVGGKYADVWHYKHMTDPREISPGSNMPPYDHLSQEALDFSKTANKLRVMRNVGVPYKPDQIQTAEEVARSNAATIAAGLAENAGVAICEEPSTDCELLVNSRMVALIAYLQRLGRVPADKPSAAADTKEVAP